MSLTHPLMELLEEKIKKPAFLRQKQLKIQGEKKLILTAFDRKQAGFYNKHSLPPLKKTTLIAPRKHSSLTAKSSRPIKKSNRMGGKFSAHTIIETPSQITKNNKPSFFPQVSVEFTGIISRYFEKINVGVIELKSTLKEGDIIIIGRNKQLVDSMQINQKPVKTAKKGADIGIKLKNEAQIGEKVFIVKIS